MVKNRINIARDVIRKIVIIMWIVENIYIIVRIVKIAKNSNWRLVIIIKIVNSSKKCQKIVINKIIIIQWWQ